MDLRRKYGPKEEIRKDIEQALEGVVKPRQLRSLLPLELKNVSNIRVQQQQPKPKKQVAAAAAAKQPEPVIEFRGKISRMGNRRIIGVPSYLFEHVRRVGTREIKVMIF